MIKTEVMGYWLWDRAGNCYWRLEKGIPCFVMTDDLIHCCLWSCEKWEYTYEIADLAKETSRQNIGNAYWCLSGWYDEVWLERDVPPD